MRKRLKLVKDRRTPHKGGRYVDGLSNLFAVEVKSSKSNSVTCSFEDWEKTREVAASKGKIPVLVLTNKQYTFLCFDLDVMPRGFFDALERALEETYGSDT